MMSWHCWICGGQEAPNGKKRFVILTIKEDFHPTHPHTRKPRVIEWGVVHADCLRMCLERF